MDDFKILNKKYKKFREIFFRKIVMFITKVKQLKFYNIYIYILNITYNFNLYYFKSIR